MSRTLPYRKRPLTTEDSFEKFKSFLRRKRITVLLRNSDEQMTVVLLSNIQCIVGYLCTSDALRLFSTCKALRSPRYFHILTSRSDFRVYCDFSRLTFHHDPRGACEALESLLNRMKMCHSHDSSFIPLLRRRVILSLSRLSTTEIPKYPRIEKLLRDLIRKK